MPRFIESICFQNGSYNLIDLHQKRIEETFKKYFPLSIPFNLESHLPALDLPGKYKVRMEYDNESIDVEFAEYVPRRIKTLRLVDGGELEYRFKYENRKALDILLEERGTADDVIITKDNRITDGSYFNLAFWDGQLWYTPHTYLLNGIKRQYYLRKQMLRETKIEVSDIPKYQKVSLINAMLNLGELEVSVEDIS